MWSTQFKNKIRLSNLEKKLAPKSSIVYCKPPALSNMLLNYKTISKPKEDFKKDKHSSQKCNKCGLCGKYGNLKNMVIDQDKIITKSGKEMKLKNNLTCKNYGIYGAQCKICKEIYIGQTKNKFSIRWNSHRKKWKDLINTRHYDAEKNKNMDEAALVHHYKKHHQNNIKNLNIADAFVVFFVEEPKYHFLDIRESYWISKLSAKINIAKTILPKFR